MLIENESSFTLQKTADVPYTLVLLKLILIQEPETSYVISAFEE